MQLNLVTGVRPRKPSNETDNMRQEPFFVTIPEAQRLLSVGRTHLYRLIDDGAIQRVKVGGRALIPFASIETFAASLVEAPR